MKVLNVRVKNRLKVGYQYYTVVRKTLSQYKIIE